MERVFKARFEAGVFRPLGPVDLPEGSTVELAISSADWEERLRALLDRVRARGGGIGPAEIEVEIERAAEEVRAERQRRP